MSARIPKHRMENGGPRLLPQLNKCLFVCLLILAVHLPGSHSAISHFSMLSQFFAAAAGGTESSGGMPPVAPPDLAVPLPSAPPASTADWAKLKTPAEVRTEADANTPVLLRAEAGETFPIKQEKGDWLQIQVDAKQRGWILAKQAAKQEMDSQQIQIAETRHDAKLYWGPDEMFGAAQQLAVSADLLPEQVGGQWLRLANQKEGRPLWVKTADVAWTSGMPPAKAVWADNVKILSADSAPPRLPLEHKTIVVDPGHGGKDPGAIAKIRPVYERDVNLAAAEVLAEKLKAAGAQVIMTRSSNDQYVSLEQRVKISNGHQADVFVSIHQNMYPADPSVSGSITFYHADNSKILAQDIDAAVTRELDSDQGKERVEQEQLYVLTHNLRPAVLVEGCFLSNPQQLSESLLPEYQERLAEGIFQGIVTYLQ